MFPLNDSTHHVNATESCLHFGSWFCRRCHFVFEFLLFYYCFQVSYFFHKNQITLSSDYKTQSLIMC